jgi:TonB family protein
MAIAVTIAFAQPAHAAGEQHKRKVQSRVVPEYPELARQHGISGTVKIQVQVSSSGAVKSAKVIGGHPLLVKSALEAVKKWKYEAAASDTTELVEITFQYPGSGP